jgi:hypothetical protein
MTGALATVLRSKLGQSLAAAVREAGATTVDDVVAQHSGNVGGDCSEERPD